MYFNNPGILDGRKIALQKHHLEPKPKITYDLVAPIRMRWDDCFNHVHFQTVPMIAAIFEFHQKEWNRITWHVSKYGAGLLLLMDVPLERMAIEIPVKAKEILLPWYANWNPLQTATIKGVTRRTCNIITKNLLAKQIDASVQEKVDKLVVSIVDPTLNNSYNAMAERGGDGDLEALLKSEERLVVFFSRPMHE